jgi:stalled ribosome rescue protein Dom34
MPTFHAVVWVDHQRAQVLQFDPEQVHAQTIKAHDHYTAQHGSRVRTEHEFFGEICDALKGIVEVLVTGPRTGVADFRHYLGKHRPDIGAHVVGFEVVDHPTDNQLVALARKFFLRIDRMKGIPTPG